MVTTYQYGSGASAITYEVDYTGDEVAIIEKNPFLIENKRVSHYTSASDTYYPLQLIENPSILDGKTLSAVLVDTGKVTIVGAGSGGSNVDISDSVLNAILKKGKNQPFSYVVLTVSKQLYIEQDITLEQKFTQFVLNIYGMSGTWVYERLEDNGATYDITLVSPAYYLKTITLLSLFNFTISGTTVTLSNVNLSSTITWTDDEGTFTVTFDTNRTLTFGIKRVSIGNSNYQYSLTKLINVKVDDLFVFLAHYVAGYDYTNGMDIGAGYYYNANILGVPNGIHDTYTMQDIETIANSKDPIVSGTTLFENVTIRLDEFAWDVLNSLALLSNREIIFDDKAYFKPLNQNPSGNISIDWERPENPVSGTFYPEVLALAENDDQGSQYVTSSQKVISEAYETTVAISDTTSTYVGQDIKFIGADDTKQSTSSTNNSVRNKQAKIIALNALIKNYKPGDCIEYTVNETAYPATSTIITSWSQLSSVTEDAFIYQTMLPNSNIVAFESYYIKKNGVWFEYDTDNPIMQPQYTVTSCVAEIEDKHNNITLEDAPVALITIEYPACLTTYTWGNPEFMDEQSQFNDLSAVSQDSVLDNTSDTGISSSDATKIVVGNQAVHQLLDDRTGFTGLIMEKNADNNVYRLVGYNQGAEQAQFNSEGKIVAGANLVTLSDTGITIGTSPTDSPTSISLSKESTIQIVDETTTPAVSINADGSSFKGDVVFDKTITVDDGIILGEHGSMLSGGTLNITVSDVGQTFSSPIVISSPAQGESIAGTYLDHRYTTSLHDLDSTIDYQDVGGTPTFSKVIWEGSEPTATTIKNVLTGASSSYIEFSYESAKNPENWPSMLLENMNLSVSSALETQPDISTSPYIIPSITTISLPIKFYRSTSGELNESVQVTIGYKMSNYSYGGSGSPTITPINTIYYTSSEISLNSQWSGSDQYKVAYVDIPVRVFFKCIFNHPISLVNFTSVNRVKCTFGLG